MKFEFVDFYPVSKKVQPPNKKFLGTVHIYIIDYDMDIRGIKVVKNNKSILFFMPLHTAYDDDTGEKVKYPICTFASIDKNKKVLDFLHTEVKPKILERIAKK